MVPGRAWSARSSAQGPHAFEKTERHPAGPNHSLTRLELRHLHRKGPPWIHLDRDLDGFAGRDLAFDPVDAGVPRWEPGAVGQGGPDGVWRGGNRRARFEAFHGPSSNRGMRWPDG